MSPRGVYNYIRTGLATVACSQEAFDAGPAHKAGQRGDRPGPLGRRGPGPTSSSPAHQETILIPLKKLLIFSTFLLCSRVVDSPPPGSLRILQSEQRRRLKSRPRLSNSEVAESIQLSINEETVLFVFASLSILRNRAASRLSTSPSLSRGSNYLNSTTSWL